VSLLWRNHTHIGGFCADRVTGGVSNRLTGNASNRLTNMVELAMAGEAALEETNRVISVA